MIRPMTAIRKDPSVVSGLALRRRLAKELAVIAAAQSRTPAVPHVPHALPPFRADHVGSLLRPPALAWARAKAEAGALTPGELQRIKDVAIQDAAALQEATGLNVVTDGEFRRAYFHLDFLTAIEGVQAVVDPTAAHFHKADGKVLEFSPPRLRVTGRLRRSLPIMRRDFEILAAATDEGRTPKITIPSPSMGLRGGRGAVSEIAYPEL